MILLWRRRDVPERDTPMRTAFEKRLIAGVEDLPRFLRGDEEFTVTWSAYQLMKELELSHGKKRRDVSLAWIVQRIIDDDEAERVTSAPALNSD